jgi:hypothetical protein
MSVPAGYKPGPVIRQGNSRDDQEDFRIEVDSNTVTITSEKNIDQEQKDDERYSRKEFSVVDDDKIEANMKMGSCTW